MLTPCTSFGRKVIVTARDSDGRSRRRRLPFFRDLRGVDPCARRSCDRMGVARGRFASAAPHPRV